jgi:plastocyanin
MKLLLSALVFVFVSFTVKPAPPSAYLTASETLVPVGTTVTFTGYNYVTKQVSISVKWIDENKYANWYAYPDRNGTVVFTFPFSDPGEYQVLAFINKGQKVASLDSVHVSVY